MNATDAARPLDVNTAVVGSGPAALAHALFASAAAPVVLCGRRRSAAPGVERVPAALLTLLLEVGIIPAELDVDHLTTKRLVAWEDGAPAERLGPACAHLDRAALVEALWGRVEDRPDVHLRELTPWFTRPGVEGRFVAGGWMARRLVDATGRRALTARRHVRPPRPWVATCCTVERGDLDAMMMVAAGPDGYGYRLGSARCLTVAWVGPHPPLRDAAALRRRLDDEGAGWLSRGVPFGGGRWSRRVASVDVPVRAAAPNVVAIGDAALARDALASQGASMALSDARLAATPIGAAILERRHGDGLERHLRSLCAAIDTSRYRDQPTWSTYRRWVDGHARLRAALRYGGQPGSPATVGNH